MHTVCKHPLNVGVWALRPIIAFLPLNRGTTNIGVLPLYYTKECFTNLVILSGSVQFGTSPAHWLMPASRGVVHPVSVCG